MLILQDTILKCKPNGGNISQSERNLQNSDSPDGTACSIHHRQLKRDTTLRLLFTIPISLEGITNQSLPSEPTSSNTHPCSVISVPWQTLLIKPNPSQGFRPNPELLLQVELQASAIPQVGVQLWTRDKEPITAALRAGKYRFSYCCGNPL